MDTLRINDPKKPGDFLVINRRDFDEKRHTLYGEAPQVVTETPAEPVKPAPRRTARR